MTRFYFVLLTLLSVSQAPAEILISTVAQVKNHVITSRELQIHQLISHAWGEDFQSFAQGQKNEEVIREWMLYFEASSFYSSPVAEAKVTAQVTELNQKLITLPQWRKLGVQSVEIKEKVKRHLEAVRLFRFKKKASLLPVGLSDIEREYTQNRIRYGNQSFAEVKEKIRSQLSQTHLKQRMAQWFEILEEKYKVQRF